MPPPLSAAVLLSSPFISDIFVSKQKGRISTVLTGILDFKGPPSWAIVGFLSLLAAPQPHLLGWVWVLFFQTKAGVLGTVSGISFLLGTPTTPNKIWARLCINLKCLSSNTLFASHCLIIFSISKSKPIGGFSSSFLGKMRPL